MLPALLLPLLAFATTALASPTKRDLITDKGFRSVGHEGTCVSLFVVSVLQYGNEV